MRRNRDVLLVDLRGTGRSSALVCSELEGEDGGQEFLDGFLPAGKVRACRDRLKKEADLAWYTTDAAIDDVEEVRTALGYGPLNLMGGSYGTRAVLTYLRRHPRSVRTATLDGVVAPDARNPLGLARATQQALDGLLAECESDPACRGAFPKLREPVVSDVPALLLSGERDPATPAADAERVARTLKRSRHLVIPDSAHGTDGLRDDGCLASLRAAFIEAGAAEGLDASCLAGIRRPEFALSLVAFDRPAEPEAKVSKADLERLVGTYSAPEMRLALKAELAGDRLRLSVLMGPPFPPALLIPTSPTHFRWEGEGLAPGLAVEFVLEGDKASALRVVQPGKPEVVMARTK
ncbi:MAG: alpha/beta fold hydrolase [Acidobacteriota bacterium]